MPFIGELNGETVVPEEIPDQTDVYCTICDGRMRPRGPFSNGSARHFYHLSDAGTCAGGESDIHRKWKSLAFSALRVEFSDVADAMDVEMEVDVPQTETQSATRYADAMVWFTESHDTFGQGLAVEVQHRNTQKNIEATTHDYLSNDISVYWADKSDFDRGRFLIDNLLEEFDLGKKSTTAYSPRCDAPPPLSGQPKGLKTSNEDAIQGGRWTRKDPIPACRHEFVDQGREYRCIRCGLEVRWLANIFDGNSYILTEVIDPEQRVLVADKETVENNYEPPNIVDEGTPPSDHRHMWGKPDRMPFYVKHRCHSISCKSEIRKRDDRTTIEHKESGSSSIEELETS